jgi:hypothetical protein
MNARIGLALLLFTMRRWASTNPNVVCWPVLTRSQTKKRCLENSSLLLTENPPPSILIRELTSCQRLEGLKSELNPTKSAVSFHKIRANRSRTRKPQSILWDDGVSLLLKHRYVLNVIHN